MVERKKLVSVSDVKYGYPFESSLFSEDSNYIPLIRIRDVKPAKASTFYSGDILEDYIIHKGDILVGMDGEFNLGKWNDRDGLLNKRVLKLQGIDGRCLNGYLFHYMGPVFKRIEKETAGGSVKHLSAKTINNIIIPIPSLSEQQRIVDILDTFTSLIENLKQQVALRRKQYEYYCDKYYGGDFDGMMALANIPENTVVPFAELGTITRGKRFVRDDVRESGQPCIHYGDMYTYYGTKAYQARTFLDRDFPKTMRYAKKGDVVIVGAGENDYDIGVGVVWLGDEPAAVHDACYILEHQQNPMYISYYLRTNIYHQQLKKYVSSGKISSFSADGLGKVFIPVQSVDKQNEIVASLEKFEASIANLEAQLELRQKQYEYYRNQLLTFE